MYAKDLRITSEDQLRIPVYVFCVCVLVRRRPLYICFRSLGHFGPSNFDPGPEKHELGSSCQLNGLAQMIWNRFKSYNFNIDIT